MVFINYRVIGVRYPFFFQKDTDQVQSKPKRRNNCHTVQTKSSYQEVERPFSTKQEPMSTQTVQEASNTNYITPSHCHCHI
jgi:hypothetical protein